MAALAQIERVLFLQRVAMFSHCSAAQIMRIASIASERSCGAGEHIYRVNDPADALYCVVRGAVELENPSHDSVVAEEAHAFGVMEILSGRLRYSDAAASEDSLLLAIEAEDFFDLLSNNIEIVRGLFRFLSDRVPGPLAW